MVMTVDEAELQQYLGVMETFPGVRVGVIGDLVADSYVYGIACRVSREAPVLILRYEREEFFPGGAANTVSNLLALGSRVLVLGMVGDDPPGKKLLKHLEAMGADISSVICSPAWKTIAKSRILAGDYHTKKQQMLRIDQEPGRSPTSEELDILEEKVRAAADSVDAWVVSDYGYNLLSPGIFQFVRDEVTRGKVAVADSRYRIREFRGLTLVTPNEAELLSAYGLDQVTIEGDIDEVIADTGRRLLRDLETRAVLVTRGNRGMMLFEPGQEPRSIPISGTADIVDVSGAGDTVVSAVTLSLAGHSSLQNAARLANIAAGVKVMKHGTLPVSSAELRVAAWKLAMNGRGPSNN